MSSGAAARNCNPRASGSGAQTGRLTVFYDGACPLCQREIRFLRARRGATRIDWRDVSKGTASAPACGVEREALLARFHVQREDGTMLSGARAFAELWSALPAMRWLGWLARRPALLPFLERAYERFLRVRPALQRLVSGDARRSASELPRWLERELRSDHAGETGAVAIYRGVLHVSTDAGVREFARRHLETETRHLERVETLLPASRRSRLLGPWRLAGYLTGALPALFGPAAVYATIESVETFVDRHYTRQIDALEGDPRQRALRDTLIELRGDERAHRDEASARRHTSSGAFARIWGYLVAMGSAGAVALARRL